MARTFATAGGLAVLLGWGLTAGAQDAPRPLPTAPALPPVTAPAAGLPIPVPDAVPEEAPARRSGLESHSLPAEIAEDTAAPSARGYGPTAVDDVGFLKTLLSGVPAIANGTIRTFGWLEGGYTGASTGTGPLSVQPRQNLYGNEFIVNQIGLVVQKPLKQDQLDWGFNIRYFAGADAALGQPKGGIDDPPGNERFGQDFRDLYVSAHLPILTDGGVNLKVGRMNSIIGWNGFLAPYRPFYSSDYQFFYSQDGAFTGALAQLVVNDQLDVWSGVTLGANTFFTKRSSNSVCYIGQINYWLTTEKRTRLTASTYLGPDAIFAAPGLNGDFVSMFELRVQQNWSEKFTQVVQSNFGWDTNTAVGTGSWFGVYTVGIYHLNCEWDVLARGEWFRDVRGTRTGTDTDYSEVTLGLNWHPNAWLELRPEIRGDFAGAPAYGNNGTRTDRNQLTGAMSFLIKF